MSLPRTILVATDFSEHADHALEYAVVLAARLDATIHLVESVVRTAPCPVLTTRPPRRNP